VKIRNCAWIDASQAESRRAVWARGGFITFHCPKSLITAQSIHFLEQFRMWKEFGGGTPWLMDAKTAEALLVLEQVWRKENEGGQI
jgi:hypothetical protein